MNEQLTPEKLQELTDKLAELAPGVAQGSAPPEPDGPFDPTGYDIDPKVSNLYARARWETIGGQRKLIAVVIDTMTVTKWIDPPATGRFWPEGHPEAGEAIALGDFITQAENSDEGWRLFAVFPRGKDHAVAVLRRAQKLELAVPRRLDDPAPSTTTPEPEPTSEDDLETKAEAWEQSMMEATDV